MIVNVVVMGQIYGGEYLLEDFLGCCSILDALDQYCGNEDWNSIISKHMFAGCAVVLYYLI